MGVYLYDRKRIVELVIRENGGVRNWNLPMNSNDFRIFKDVQNDIDFIVRNTDRKPVNMAGRTAKINLFDQETNRLLHQQDLIVTNEAKGMCKLVLLPDVTADWYLQTYSYSVQVTNLDGSTHMLHVDWAESDSGFFQLAQGPFVDPRPSYEITYDQLTHSQISINGANTSFRLSSAYPGSLQRNNVTGVHTVAALINNFSGTFKVQGSVDTMSPTEESWFDLQVSTYDHETTQELWTFDANLMWVRFWVMNRYEQFDVFPLDSDIGSVAKIMFRN